MRRTAVQLILLAELVRGVGRDAVHLGPSPYYESACGIGVHQHELLGVRWRNALVWSAKQLEVLPKRK